MTKPATAKQIAYIADLTAQALGNARGMSMAQSAYNTVLVLALPEVTTMDEASEQIDALRWNELTRYYQATPERKAMVEAKLQLLAAVYGQDFKQTPDHRDVGPAAWVEAIAAIVNPPAVEEVAEQATTETAVDYSTAYVANHGAIMTAHAIYHAEYDRLSAEHQAARKPEGVIDRFRNDLTADEQAAIDHNDRLLTEWLETSAALQARRVAKIAGYLGVADTVVKQWYGNPVLAS